MWHYCLSGNSYSVWKQTAVYACVCVTLTLAADAGTLRIPSVNRPVCSKIHNNCMHTHTHKGGCDWLLLFVYFHKISKQDVNKGKLTLLSVS